MYFETWDESLWFATGNVARKFIGDRNVLLRGCDRRPDGSSIYTVTTMSGVPHTRGVRVLVVDDHRPFADLLVRVLRSHGCEAQAVYKVEETFSAAEAFSPQALVIAVGLPDSGGFNIAKECGKRLPSCRVLLTSAWSYEQEGPPAQEGFDVVPKAVLVDMLFDFLGACTRSQNGRGC
jgi:CheY-like chemotaxis protein